MFTLFMTPLEVTKHLAKTAKEKRLSLNFSQETLAKRAGVSLAVLKKFEQTGKISVLSLLKLALVLDSLNNFIDIFKAKSPESFATLDQLLQQKDRKRGRK